MTNHSQFIESWQSGQSFFLLHTSGSTGTPKPIKLSRQQLEASALLTGKTFGLQAGDHALVCLNTNYIAGLMMLVRGMVLNLKMTIVEPSANPLEGLSLDQPIDFVAFVPMQLQTILANHQYIKMLNNAKAILVGGAAPTEALMTQIQQLKVPVYSTYGMTETATHIAIRQLNGTAINDSFMVLEGIKVDVDDENCIKIWGANTDFQWVQTNDVIEMIDTQHFRLLGRRDNIINSGGIKIQLEKIDKIAEQCLLSIGVAQRVFSWGIPDNLLGTKLILVIECETLDKLNEEEFRKLLASQLSKYEMPKELYYIENFTETLTGKIDKSKTINSTV